METFLVSAPLSTPSRHFELLVKNYKEALEYLYSQLPMYQRQGAAAYKKDLTNTLRLCQAVGNPEKRLKTIHIAGTNGKGTTSHLIAGGLQAQNLKVGLYTSPHYKDFRERIKINGKYISPQFIIRFINTYSEAIQSIKPSFFELTFVMALKYFAAQNVDVAIIETGLGGRLDSTNVITPLLSVITNISYDHQNMLGDTLQAIAGEKAGIIKNTVPTIIGETQNEVEDVFIKKACETQSTILFADKVTELHSFTEKGLRLYNVYVHNQLWMENLRMDIEGPYQDKNIITALFSLYYLQNLFTIDRQKIRDFFPHLAAHTKYIGRWHLMGTQPTVLADSAHNEAGFKNVLDRLKEMNKGQLHFVLGFVNDKNIDDLIQLFPHDAHYFFAKANIPRGLDAKNLQTMAQNAGLKGRAYSSVKNAYKAAKRQAEVDDLIYIGGSIFVVAECL